jgi:transcriptional regulator with XRE-family HTH domain
MSVATSEIACDLAYKIARLVEERGWNQEDFARFAHLNRQTIRQILIPNGPRRLRNATIAACAKALGLSVSELRDRPLEQLLPRMNRRPLLEDEEPWRRLYEQATQPEVVAWLENHPDRARQFAEDEIDELLSLQGTGGPLTASGIEHFVGVMERKRQIIQQVHAIAGTEYLELLEKFIRLLYEKVQPYRERS